jgi:hypothetical protein
MWKRFEWLNASCELIFDPDFQTPRSSERQRASMPFLVLLVGSRGSECGFSIDTQCDPLSEILPVEMMTWTIPQTCSADRWAFSLAV